MTEHPTPPIVPYLVILAVHSFVRWIAIVAGLVAVMAAWRVRSDTRTVDRCGLFLMIALDLQLALGLLLYFVFSPVTTLAVRQVSQTLRNPMVRFFAFDHVIMMVAAVALVHAGRIRARRAVTAEVRRARLRLAFGLAFLLMLVGTPWPGQIIGRPLFRSWEAEREAD